MVIPLALREEAGVSEGTLLKVVVVEGPRFLITPQFTVDRPLVEGPRKNRQQLLRELAKTVAEVRQEAKEKGLDKLPKPEIERAVAAARGDRLKASRRPAK